MKNLSILIGFVLLCAAACVFASCEGDQYRQDNKPLDATNEGTHAKDRSIEQSCTNTDLLITDCLDACSCCDDPNAADLSLLTHCDFLCDEVLLKAESVPLVSTMNQTLYKECVVGCFSICDKPNRDIQCYEECKVHLLGV